MAALLPKPEPLSADHDLSTFSCGAPTIDEWLKDRALANQLADATRTYVVAPQRRVVGYYSLAASSLARGTAPGAVARNMPDPIPAVLLARLGVDESAQHQGLGRGLLRDALLRSQAISTELGARAVVVEASTTEAASFYERHGFAPSRSDPLMLMVLMKDITRGG